MNYVVASRSHCLYMLDEVGLDNVGDFVNKINAPNNFQVHSHQWPLLLLLLWPIL